jgi:histidinol-phosphatase (PHP family)
MTEAFLHTRFDCHMHTPLCGHAVGEPREYVEVAAARGLSMITFTCHIPMPGEAFCQAGIRMRREELPRYREMVEQARGHGRQLGVEVLYGIEAEIHPDPAAMREMDAILAAEPFDYVLGSLHANLPAFRQWLAGNKLVSDAQKIAGYFQCLAEGAASGRYHSLAHPDVVRIYGTLEGPLDPLEHQPVITDFLDVVAGCGVCLEINTSGLIKENPEVHPDPLIMKWALERGIPFTIGSDSHQPDRVGDPFEAVLRRLKPLGLSQLHYFKGGQRVGATL